jgi:ATP-dependent DNA helicase RecQ
MKTITDNANKYNHSIETHLSYYVGTGELDIDTMVAPDKQELIKEAAARFGRLSLKLLKDNLPEEISYTDIKMVLAHLAATVG